MALGPFVLNTARALVGAEGRKWEPEGPELTAIAGANRDVNSLTCPKADCRSGFQNCGPLNPFAWF